jgi:hypothetical protein
MNGCGPSIDPPVPAGSAVFVHAVVSALQQSSATSAVHAVEGH